MLSRSSWCLCPFRLKLTGLSSSIQNPFFIAIHEARWTELPVTFLSVQMESVRPLPNSSDGDSVPLWCPFHSRPQCLCETLSGPFIVHSFSSHRSHAMVSHVKAAWLTRWHVLWAYCTVRMDGWYVMVQYEPVRPLQDGLWVRHSTVCLTSSHFCVFHIRSADILSTKHLISLSLFGCSAKEADTLGFSNINVMSFLL